MKITKKVTPIEGTFEYEVESLGDLYFVVI